MASPEEWLVCSACGLRHSARPNGLCPRCHGSLLSPADVSAEVLRPPPVSRMLTEKVPPGWRIAGAAFLVNGFLGAASAFFVRNPYAGTGRIVAGSAVSALVSFLLGAGLLRGSDGARKAALWIAGIALFGTGVFALFTQFWLAAGLAALLCGAYFLLLVGEPGAGRLAAGSAVLAAGLVVGAVAAMNPRLVASKFLAGAGLIDARPVARVAARGWSLTFPPDRWYGAKAAAADAPSVTFERQFLRPEGPAHAIVVSVTVPANRGFDMDAMADAISKGTRRQFDEWEVLEIAPLPGRGGTRVIHVRATLKGEKLEMLCGLFPNPPAFYEVVVGAERDAFPRLREELQAILESFQSGPGS